MKLFDDIEHSDFSDILVLQKNTSLPHNLQSYIELTENNITVLSDLTGQNEISIYISGPIIIVTDSLEKLVNFIHNKTKKNLTLCTNSVSHLLHDAIVPAPYTIYKEIFSLAIGNSMSINIKTGAYEINDNYPYMRSLSRQDSTNSTSSLLEKISDSLDKGTRENESILMLSSGKDSVSLAIACAEIGVKCKAVTFKSSKNDKESEVAKLISKICGLEHEVITVEQTHLEHQQELITRFFQQSIHPCVDFVQLGYLQALIKLGVKGKTIIDGTGNDSYFGGVPCKTDYIKYRFTMGNQKISDYIKPIIRHSNILSYLLRNDAEINFATRTLRTTETEKWFSHSFDTSNYWREQYSLKNTNKDRETYYIDLEAHIRGRDYDRSCSFLKTRLAANFTESQMFYPYCDSKLIDYCFNLPEKHRFNMKKHINKILLREMLNEKIQYDSLARNKLGFNFEGRDFIKLQEPYVKHEILNCKIWDQNKMSPFLNKALKLLDRNYYESHAILLLFLLSGWLNHNQYLNNSNS